MKNAQLAAMPVGTKFNPADWVEPGSYYIKHEHHVEWVSPGYYRTFTHGFSEFEATEIFEVIE